MNLHTAGHRRGVVCAPHTATVEVGRAILAECGNALEAMVAMAASIAVVYPHMNGVGGDGFWLVREPSGRVYALMAAGRAGELAQPELYRGDEAVPPRGPLAALTVPGAVGGWMLALEAAKALGGTMPPDVLLGRAIRQAADGVAIGRNLAGMIAAVADELRGVSGFAPAFLTDGKPPAAGHVLRQPALAATLEQIAHAGLADFYRGDVAREMAADLERIGSPVTRADLARYAASVASPLTAAIGAGTLFNTPLPTQGLTSLMILALFDRLRVTAGEGFDHLHGLIEAAKRALAVRDGVVTDPDRQAEAPDRFLAGGFLDREAAMIDRRRAGSWRAGGDRGDTIWMGAADRSGLVVSYIQSLYWEFGSGVVLPRTGVLMQNRGTAFALDPRALNFLQPGRLPPHTLNPALAVLRDGRIIAYGTMGGDAQPQIQAALFTRYVAFRQRLDEALDRPRWYVGRTWGAPRGSVVLEGRFDDEVIDRLMSAGHDVEVMAAPYAGTMGHAGAVVLHPDGTLEAAHDPRADGGADGL